MEGEQGGHEKGMTESDRNCGIATKGHKELKGLWQEYLWQEN